MTKLCARGKAAAKRKFKVYPSAYANAYASKICAGKIKDPSGVSRKMGRHWSSEEEWAVSSLREIKQLKEKISKMRTPCKSHTDERFAKGECCQTKKSCG